MSKIIVKQTELAEFFGVNRVTIREWQIKGMPYRKAKGKGHSGEYVSPLCLNWRVGDVWNTKYRWDLNSIEKILAAWIGGHMIGRDRFELDAESEKHFESMIDHIKREMGASESEVFMAIGKVKQILNV